jgi:hypothetical protein
MISGMRVNFHKSELVSINMEEESEVQTYAEIFGCPVGELPIKYLGIPLQYQKLRREDLQPLVDKIIKRIAGRREKLPNKAGRIILIKACLPSIPIYLMSFFKFPRWVIDLINSHMSNCFWDDYEGHKKLHLVNWHLVCMEKEYGGLGVPNLKGLNLFLLGSWIKMYIKDEGKLWRSIVDIKYCNKDNIFYTDKAHASPFWKRVILVAQAVKFGYRWVPGNGRKIHFWEDTWFGTTPLDVQFLELYCISNEKTKTISEIVVDGEVRLTFRRSSSMEMMQVWDDLMAVVEQVNLNEDFDALVWVYEKTGSYSSHSFYAVIGYRGVTPMYIPAIWNIKVPPKIQLFIWLLSHNKLATVDNLNKNGMSKPERCCFCSENESIRYLFFECSC